MAAFSGHPATEAAGRTHRGVRPASSTRPPGVCCLTRRGLPVMVYPGQFSTLAEIAAGRHPQAPDELRDLTFVSLRLQGR
ncbi:hypothetical protein GCM10010278_35400 [Streptomyces melanogenes]|nr:hypothetical protein GCM10010278_35400 [Streptomyces melanogenes]